MSAICGKTKTARFRRAIWTIDTVVEKGAHITVPWLLVHGTEDDVVPLGDSQDILAKAGTNAELVVLDGAGHVFSDHADEMVESVVGWIKGELG